MKLKNLITCIPALLKQARYLRQNRVSELNEAKVIISLTAVPYRFHSLHLVLASLLNQSALPLAIHLWLDKASMSRLPKKVLALEKYGVCFHEVDDLRSHKKLIYALKEFPNHSIITVDDDVIYPSWWLEGLLSEHQQYPDEILAYSCKKLCLDAGGSIDTYESFPRVSEGDQQASSSYFGIGYSGILYPAGSLSQEVHNQEYFMAKCATADDIWFKAMALLQGSVYRKVNASFGKEINPPFTQGKRLTKLNVRQNLNDIQIQNVFNDYDLYQYLEG